MNGCSTIGIISARSSRTPRRGPGPRWATPGGSATPIAERRCAAASDRAMQPPPGCRGGPVPRSVDRAVVVVLVREADSARILAGKPFLLACVSFGERLAMAALGARRRPECRAHLVEGD